MRNSKIKRNKNSIIAVVLVTLVVLVAVSASLIAKYVFDNKNNAQMLSSDFHFTSNYLEEKQARYEINNWQNGFDIELYNYEKDNKALISNTDIKYTVTVNTSSSSGSWGCEDPNGGVLKKSSTKSSNTLNLIKSVNAKQGDKVTVTVKTTYPFVKTISAEFILSTVDSPSYTIDDNNDGTVTLTIKSNDSESTVNVSWDKDYYDPDSTNKYMTSWSNNSGTGSLTLEKNTTYKLIFFKNKDFTLKSVSGEGADVKIPNK